MNRLSMHIKRILQFCITGSCAVVLAACYGVQVEEMYNNLVQKKLTCTSESNEPIPGLKVTVTQNGQPAETLSTDSVGTAEFLVEEGKTESYTVHIEDVDGGDNGGDFASETFAPDSSKDEYKLNMTEKTSQ